MRVREITDKCWKRMQADETATNQGFAVGVLEKADKRLHMAKNWGFAIWYVKLPTADGYSTNVGFVV